MNIELYTYTEQGISVDVPFETEEGTFLNATEVYKAFGKNESSFRSFKTRSLEPYAQRLIDLGKIASAQNARSLKLSDLIIVRKGGNLSNTEQGTWLHPKLAVAFARWLSMDFEIWCDEKIATLLKEGYAGATDEIQKELELIASQSQTISAYVRKKGTLRAPQILALYSSIDKSNLSIKYFKKEIAKITNSASTENLKKIYEKLLKELKVAFDSDEISRETRDSIRDYLNTYYIALLKRRLTVAQKSTTVDQTQEVKDLLEKIDEHEKRSARQVQHISELNIKLKSKDKVIESLKVDQDDPRPIKFDLRTTHLSEDFQDAINKLRNNNYVVMISSNLTHNNNKANTKHPDWAGDSAQLFIGVGIWENEGSLFFKMNQNKYPFSPLAEATLYEHADNPDLFIGSDLTKRHFVTFNKVTRTIIVYRKK